MKIVLDTNCLLPAVFSKSVYHWIWEAFRQGKFVDCALNAGARYIVTNDKHFDVIKNIPFPKIEVIDIVAFKKIID